MALTVTNNTSLTTIKDFLGNEGKNKTILAKTNNEGQTVLYTRNAIKGLFHNIRDVFKHEVRGDGFHSKFSLKRDLARTTLAGLVRSYQADKGGQLTQIAAKTDKGVLTAIKVNEVLNWAADNIEVNGVSARKMAKALSNLEQLTETVTSAMNEIPRISQELDPLKPNSNKELGTNKPLESNGRNISVPHLQIGGKIYIPQRVLGEGAFGIVTLYRNNDGEDRVVKLPTLNALENPEIHKSDVRRELSIANTLRQDNNRIAGFNDHVELKNGFALVGEMVTKGDLTNFAEKLKNVSMPPSFGEKIPAGKISDIERKLIGLTLLKDTAEGLAQMHEGKGISHGDVKSQNVMLSSSGEIKLIDFGESGKTSGMRPGIHRFADIGLYRAPEVAKNQRSFETKLEETKVANKDLLNSLTDGLLEAFNFGSNRTSSFASSVRTGMQGLKNNLLFDLDNLMAAKNSPHLQMNDSFDSFGLGTIGFELLIGGRATQDIEVKGFAFVADNKLDEWAKTSAKFIGANGITTRSTGYPEMDDLLNGMLHSDANQRMTASGVRDHPIMNGDVIGSVEIRNLILAITTNDNETISQARDAMREKFGIG